MNFFDCFKPDIVYKSVIDVPFDELKAKGKSCVLLDFDNTIGPDRALEPDDYSFRCINLLREKGFDCCIVSNAKSTRSAHIAEVLGVPCVTCAKKPGTKGVKNALNMMKVDAKRAVMIGDQIFTDIFAGRKSGIYTIMVETYQQNEIWYVAIKRPFERIIRFFGGF